MNHFQLETHDGNVIFQWNAKGLLTAIRWHPHGPGSNFAFSFSKTRCTLLANRRIPKAIIVLLDQFRDFFEAGVPLGNVPWDLLETEGWSDFQHQVYRATAIVPHGETRSYSWIAERFRRVNCQRAVGQALKKNPFLVLIPCHRVVTNQNGLGGFMGKADPHLPELRFKRRLLELEHTYLNPVFPFLTSDPIEAGKVSA